ncbi:S-layer homology domain-containing protein [Gracilibacillus xinjiangensis]|uniref:S-layer homology domain-containing protein n=1 Tax=Gracilibacillus xinjiangensis TaxID=1193282 RepID=A0ABV8WRW7_9BACI
MGQTSMKSKKFFTSTMATAVVVSAVAPTTGFAASNFTDVQADNFYYDYVTALAEAGIIHGKPDGSFDLSGNVTRAEAAKMIASIIGLDTENATSANFADVKEGAWYTGYINALYSANLIDGVSETEFAPSATLTRAQFAKLVVDAYGIELDENAEVPFTDLKEGAWYEKYVKTLYANELIAGTTLTTFSPDKPVKRADFAKLLTDTDWKIGTTLEKPNENIIVESVNVIDANTVELTGAGLKNLVAEDITIDGNVVESVEYNETTGKVLVKFETSFASGEEQKITFVDVEGTETEFNFTYNFELTSLEATTSRVDNDTDGQFLEFTVNGGESVSLDYLVNAGYKVEFQATNDAVFLDAATGELNKAQLGADFAYKVVVSNGEETVESELTQVEVLDFDTYLTEVNEVSVTQGDVTVESGKVTIQDGTVDVVAEKATTLSGATENNPSVTYKSSNPAVATVNATTGAVTPIKAGSVTITASADDASVEVPLTVVSGARQATTATATTSSVKLLAAKTQDVEFEVVDQYGDEFEGELDVVTRDAAIADGTASSLTFIDGKATATLKAIANGSTAIDLNSGTTTLKSVTMSVSDDSVVASRKIETVSPSSDLTLDVVKGSDDDAVTLVWNNYNADGYLIGAETALDTTYSVESSDTSVATVDLATDDNGALTGGIIVQAQKEGTAKVVIKEGTVTRATATITVTDSTPVITSVDFEEVEDITSTSAVNEAVLKASGITLSSSEFTPELDASGAIFVDVDGVAGYSSDDITLGQLTAEYSGIASDITSLGVKAGSVVASALSAGAEGTIVAVVTREGENEAFATSTINVKVPN